MMRISIRKEPPIAGPDGIRLDCFQVGHEYEVGNTIGALFLAEGWAEPVPLGSPTRVVPFGDDDPYDSRRLYPDHPSNLVKEHMPPFIERDIASDYPLRRRRRPR